MARVVLTDANFFQRTVSLVLQNNHRVLTPSKLAAKALNIQPQSLRDAAKQRLQVNGLSIAPALTAHRIFCQVLQATLQPADIVGAAKTWLPTVRSLLQSSPDFVTSAATLSTRASQLLQLADQYRKVLAKQNLVEEADLYWQAGALPAVQETILLYGYFQPRLDELSFIDAIASDGSIFVLPAPDHSLFTDSQKALT